MPIHATLAELAAAAQAYLPKKVTRIVHQGPGHDGVFGGAAFKLANPEAECTELDFRNYKLDVASFAGQDVVFVASAPKLDDFKAMAKVAASVTIIDHGQNSVKEYADYAGFFSMPEVNKRVQHTGATMGWAVAQPGKACPMAAQCVADHTSFNKLLPDTAALVEGLNHLHRNAAGQPQLTIADATKYLVEDQQDLKLFKTAVAVGNGLLEAKKQKVADAVAKAVRGTFTPPGSAVSYSAKLTQAPDFSMVGDIATKLYAPDVDMVVMWHPLMVKGQPANKLYFRASDASTTNVIEVAKLFVYNGEPGGGQTSKSAGATFDQAPTAFFVKEEVAPAPDAKLEPMEVEPPAETGFVKPSASPF